MASVQSSKTRRLAMLQGHLQAARDVTKDSNTASSHALAMSMCQATNITVPQSGRESLEEERKNASFKPRDMTLFLDGGIETTLVKEKIMLELERDPSFRMDDWHDLTRPEVRARYMTRVKSLVHHLTNESLEKFKMRMAVIGLVDPGFMTRMGVHFGLFLGAVTGSGTPEQLAHWFSKGAMGLNGLIGCFAMTELGHGSNVAGIETRATFDADSDEFVIHTPTLTATKWWIGGAAQTATHAAVFARMIVHGRDHGPKSFVVQLRDPATFDLMPGVNIGDCGAKMGRNGIDNGWIQFTHVRIPRTNLLMKHTKVTREGIVKPPPMEQLAFGALILGRVTMVNDSAEAAKKALTIAVRYGAIRRQFSSKPGTLENKILSYPTHAYRLMTRLATTYAMHHACREMTSIYDALMARIEVAAAKGTPSDQEMKPLISALKETHATSSGLKALCTWTTLDIIEQSRQCCGGHGYSSYTGLASLYQDFAVQCTWEGDNTVLTLQAGRYLISCYRDAVAGNKQPSGVNYLNYLPGILKRQCKASLTKAAICYDWKVLQEAYDVVCANLAAKAAHAFAAHVKSGMTEDGAYQECSILRFRAAQMHCQGYLFHRFVDAVAKAPSSLQPVLTRLCTLYGLNTIQDNAGYFQQYGYFTSDHMQLIEDEVLILCQELRNEAVPLVDSFNLTDYVLNSPLGRYDGEIYTAYFDQVKRQNPPGKPYYYESHIKPILEREDEVQDRIELEDEEE